MLGLSFFVVIFGVVWGVLGVPHQVDPENLKFFVKLGDYEWQNESGANFVSTYFITSNVGSSSMGTWTDALVLCRSFGMDLATFETKEKQDHFLNLAKENWIKKKGGISAFVGGTKMGSRDWYWINTGKPVSYSLKSAGGFDTDDDMDFMYVTDQRRNAFFYNMEISTKANNLICERVVEKKV